MGKSSGGVRNNYATATSSVSVAITSSGRKLSSQSVAKMLASAESLSSLKSREVEKQLNRAISRYESVMGIRERTIKIANIGDNYGVTYINKDGSQGVFLSKSFFNQSRNAIESQYRKSNYETGFKNITNRPIQHTLTHELAHATWTSSYKSPKHVSAGKEIRALYKKWSADTKKKGYGSYGKRNVDEFWAEAVTKGIHGKSDKYTKKAISIAKQYKL